jgi:hypothetical protein
MKLRNKAAFLGAAVMAVSALTAAPTSATGPPLHGHMLVLGVKFDSGAPVGFTKCIHLAAGKAVPLNAHHAHLHTGRAGEAQWAAGHAVIPTAPLTPWANCEALKVAFPN